jgi:hypothetical protein
MEELIYFLGRMFAPRQAAELTNNKAGCKDETKNITDRAKQTIH